MASRPIKLIYDRTNNVVRDSTGAVITSSAALPCSVLGQTLKINLQAVTGAALTAYTGYATGCAAQILVDNDYANAAPIIPLESGDGNWTAGTGAEYYYAETDDIAAKPDKVYIDSVEATEGTVASLAAGAWGWDSENSRLYVRLSDDTDPDLQSDGYVKFQPVATATKPFIEVDGATINAEDSWYDEATGAFTTPDITAGQLSFEVNANTAAFYDRLGGAAQVTNTRMQIQFLEAVTGKFLEMFELAWICKNRFLPSGAELEVEISNYYSKAESDTIFMTKAEGMSGVADNGVTNAKLADMATATLKGRASAGTGDPEDLTAAQARTLLDVAEGADKTADNAPKAHAASHTSGTDDIQIATNAQKGLATAAHITAIEANSAKTGITTEQAAAITANTAKRHDSATLGTKTVDETDIADEKILVYNSSTGKLEYKEESGGTDTNSPWKSNARVATTANITLSGTQTIDGVAVVAGDRVLVKNQSTASQNGIYVVASGAWARADDLATGADATAVMVMVEAGPNAKGTTWRCLSGSVVGTDSLMWAKMYTRYIYGYESAENVTQPSGEDIPVCELDKSNEMEPQQYLADVSAVKAFIRNSDTGSGNCILELYNGSTLVNAQTTAMTSESSATVTFTISAAFTGVLSVKRKDDVLDTLVANIYLDRLEVTA